MLVSRLRAALERLNPALPPEAITAAVDELTRDRSAMSLEAANREVYLLLKEGIRVSVADTEPSPQPSPKGRGSGSSTPHPGPLPGRGGEGVRSKGGGQKPERLRVVDVGNVEGRMTNDFAATSSFILQPSSLPPAWWSSSCRNPACLRARRSKRT